jgi:hypothetical protein
MRIAVRSGMASDLLTIPRDQSDWLPAGSPLYDSLNPTRAQDSV